MKCEQLESYDQLIKECIKKREEMGLSVHKIADNIGTNSTQIINIEKGKPVYSRTFLRYLEALNVIIVI